MKNRPHNATAILATCVLLAAVASAGCTPSPYSVELPAAAPSGAPAFAGGVAAYDLSTLTRNVNWDKVPVAAVTDGF